jgi:hypothetical protein
MKRRLSQRVWDVTITIRSCMLFPFVHDRLQSGLGGNPTASLLLGGHARVGLEDNLYLEKDVLAKSSAEQVEKIIRIAKEFGIEPATPGEARKILNLKGIDKVNY